ncbi:neutral/alkaline non-lysosomal ceramidase N-terminal domain-containing protein [Sphingobacterium sp. lm-10]|uniref:neutral/alkaline non-lysosomal ceramidase N-terminal domain-containing protein n=1 Tax=Sphingobacterium sp. lm-10 TaxID=2944904 RepID=UPI0020218A6A|nr:neutral/alkaline non-lysosomal ceramidase N-terminal domain-containing protein [Sphingobacterium sp. lm-10]MCL7986872.1 neutral/alkaline non-lysosomal ceramidase N-terminal domain-containing protein [Sphingobacterium sp. lm-10]
MIKKALKIFLIVLLSVLSILFLLVERIDRAPINETTYYHAWKDFIGQKQFKEHSGPFQVGWAKINITPLTSTPMAGYGNRWGKHYEAVRDSLYVRVIAVKNPGATIYFLSADMLIIPPNITDRLEALLTEDGITLSNVHLNATHTHHGQGGWGLKLAGRLFAGAYDKQVEIRLAQKFRDAIIASTTNLKNAEVYYDEIEDADNIRNRLDVADGVIDPWIRNLTFQRSDSSQAQLVTYGAHPTVLNRKFLQLSRDYPGMLLDSIERVPKHFGMFMSGAVGSMGALSEGDSDVAWAEGMAHGLISRINSREEDEHIRLADRLVSDYIEVPMPEQSARISLNYALRPWVFRTFFGAYPTYIKITKIDDVLLLGMPADFSGEIMTELDRYAQQRGLHLIVTSFNGGYVGYITPDKRYDTDLYETTTMSWNGYHSGGYFTQMAKDIIDKFAR